MQTASEIPGLVPEKKPKVDTDTDGWDNHGDIADINYESGFNEGFNQAIDQIAPKRLEVVISGYDLIKLIKETRLTDKSRNINRSWNLTNAQAQAIGQAIIASKDNDLVTIKCVEGEPNGA